MSGEGIIALPSGLANIMTTEEGAATKKDIAEEEDLYHPFDIFRDSPLRYLGYANEVGESFRYQLPRLVAPSYAIAFGYCFAHAGTKAFETHVQYKDEKIPRELKTMVVASDTLIWQTFASVVIPGVTINLIVKACRSAVTKVPSLPPLAATWIPTLVGLSSIPFIVTPIDNAVDYVMDNTMRTLIPGVLD